MLSDASPFFAVYALAHLLMLLGGLNLFRRVPTDAAGLRLALVLSLAISAALVYDNSVIALGNTLGAGDTLLALSQPRFLLHVLATPLLPVIGWGFARYAGLKWAQGRRTAQIVAGVWLLLTLLGLFTGFFGHELYPNCDSGTFNYSHGVAARQVCVEGQTLHSGTPPVASISGALLLLGMALSLWRGTGWPGLLLGAGLMVVCAAIPSTLFGKYIANGGETALMTAFYATAWIAVQGRLHVTADPATAAS